MSWNNEDWMKISGIKAKSHHQHQTWFVAVSGAGVGGSYTVTDGGSCQLLLSMTLTLSGSWQPPAILVTNLADAVTSLVDLVFTSVIVITAALVGMILLLEPFRLLLSWRLWGDWRMRLGSFIVEIMIFPEISIDSQPNMSVKKS